MKNLILTAALVFSFTLSNAQIETTANLKTQLSEIVNFEKENLPKEMNSTEFVIMSFNIKEDGKINVIDMNYSNETIKKMLINKLSKAIIENEYISTKIHYYKILFKKL